MLQIYKQNRALLQSLFSAQVIGGPEATGAQPEPVNTVSGTPEQQEAQRESTQKRAKLGESAFQEGMKGEAVTNLQAMLTAMGFSTSGVDGSFGKNTAEGVRIYQLTRGIEPNGKVSPAVAIQIIKDFQAAEIARGNLIGSKSSGGTVPDGIIGPGTKRAINSAKEFSVANDNVRQAANDNFPPAPGQSLEISSNDITSLQSMIGTTPDGKWGPNSQKALNAHLAKGTSAVQDVQRLIGASPDGKWGPNSKSTLSAFLQGNSNGYSELGREATPVNNNKTSGLLSGVRDFFKSFRGREKVRMNIFTDLAQLDNHISAKSGLSTLEKSIHAVRNSSNEIEIQAVYDQAIQTLKSKIPNDIIEVAKKARNTSEQFLVLSYIQNALMGGAGSRERIETGASVSEYIAADKRHVEAADAALRASGFSAAVVQDIHDARNHSYEGITKRGKYEQYRWDAGENRYLFSLRSKGDIQGLQAYAGHSVEVVRTGLNITLDTSVQQQAKEVLANALDMVQIAEINRKLGRNFSKEQIVERILNGKLPSVVEFHKSANCFNDALALKIDFPEKQYPRVSEGDNNNNNTGNDDAPDTSEPGERGGSDEGGGGTGGDQGTR